MHLFGLKGCPMNFSPCHCSVVPSSAFVISFIHLSLSSLTAFLTYRFNSFALSSFPLSISSLFSLMSSLVLLLIHSFHFWGSFLSRSSTSFSFALVQFPWLFNPPFFISSTRALFSLSLSLQTLLSLYLGAPGSVFLTLLNYTFNLAIRE